MPDLQSFAMPQAPEPPPRNLRNFQCGSAQRIEESSGDKVPKVRLRLLANKHCSRHRGTWGSGMGTGPDRPGGNVKLKKPQLPSSDPHSLDRDQESSIDRFHSLNVHHALFVFCSDKMHCKFAVSAALVGLLAQVTVRFPVLLVLPL